MNNFLSQTTAVDFNIKATRVARYKFGCDLGLTHIDYVLTNPRTILNEEEASLFEATEELDAMSSVQLYRLTFAQEIRGFFVSRLLLTVGPPGPSVPVKGPVRGEWCRKR